LPLFTPPLVNSYFEQREQACCSPAGQLVTLNNLRAPEIARSLCHQAQIDQHQTLRSRL